MSEFYAGWYKRPNQDKAHFFYYKMDGEPHNSACNQTSIHKDTKRLGLDKEVPDNKKCANCIKIEKLVSADRSGRKREWL